MAVANDRTQAADQRITSYNQIYGLRVNQIDANLLDSELWSSIASHVNDIQIERVKDVTPELLALVRAYVWWHTVKRNHTSIGQSLLELKYYDLSRKGQISGNLSRWQSSGTCMSQVVLPWAKQRLALNGSETLRTRWELIETVYKTLDLVNGLVFLYYGKYRSLWERVLAIGVGRQALHQNPVNSQLYLETMNRELLWHTFAEFLAFVMPLINFYKVRNTFNLLLRTYVLGSKSPVVSNMNDRNLSDLKVCVICHEWPIDGHEIGCRHVFCYYCLMSNFLSDPSSGFTCDQCFYKIDSTDSIRRVRCFVS